MDLIKSNTLKIIVLALSLILFLLIFLIFNLRSQNNKQSIKPTISPTVTEISGIPVVSLAYSVPTLQPQEGRGVNINAPVVQKSQQSINILKNFLPYEKSLKTSSSIDVTISIPQINLQDAPWVLSIDIYGIDYQTPVNDPQYPIMKEAFREGANDTFTWMKSKGIDPESVIVSWGDKEFIRKRADEWLK